MSVMALARRVWASDEPLPPEGQLSNIKTAPPNWFREEPAYSAELYALERGMGSYRILVEDTQGTIHEFDVRVRREIVASVTPRCATFPGKRSAV